MSPAKSMAEEVLDGRERPSRHGKILGEALALIAMAGRKDAPFELPDMCSTCAFREGCMTNQMAATGKVALDCVLGLDPDRFACHHGMKDGEPSKLCVGYIAAKLAPWSFTKEVMIALTKELDAQEGPDEIRATFDAWLAKIDPKREKNDYQIARDYSRDHRDESGLALVVPDKHDLISPQQEKRE